MNALARASMVLACALHGVCAHAAEQLITPFSSMQPGTAPAGWKPLILGQVPRSAYSLVRDGDATVLKAEADASASGLAYRFDPPISPNRTLRWRWEALELPPNGDTRQRASDDAVARVYVTFAVPLSRQSAVQQMRDATFRAFYGEAPPYATLLYIWDTRAPVGAIFANPYTDRVRNIIIESGEKRAGGWLSVERNVATDYRRAFNEDSPPIRGVAVMTDSDNTKSRAAALYGDVSLEQR